MSSELPPPRRVEPPSGTAPPTAAPSPSGDGSEIDLYALAAATVRRYYVEFADEDAVYGEVGRLWCQHDLQHLLNWAALDVAGHVALDDQVAWLARILESRSFPILRLARSLELAADVARDALGADTAAPMASRLDAAAAMIRARGSFLEG
ncbi:MAG TPA: hypothetical protein VFG42_07365 [Baekduia sp.]|uniref:hypothetical protein n=1 Tax=Baekduia sp. TaxID=2600305 RepID=UPI002D7891D0|nr:hypothetical protein [Baekduia sp.]HET6506590.1 hypothetical protein [Baekduia sp.]